MLTVCPVVWLYLIFERAASDELSHIPDVLPTSACGRWVPTYVPVNTRATAVVNVPGHARGNPRFQVWLS
jgi:hypothetical protein